MNYYEHHLGDYAKDTTALTALEHGVYRLLMDFYYTKEHALPPELAKVYKAAKASSKAERAAVDLVLEEFFTRSPDGFHHKKCDEAIEKFHAMQEAAAGKNEEKKENDRERQARARERRKTLFSLLRDRGIVPPFDTKNADLEAMLSRVTGPDESGNVTTIVTRDYTASQTPVPSNQTPVKEESATALVARPSATADLQALIDGVPSLGQTLPQCPHDRVLALWAELAPELPQPSRWNDKRRKLLQTRWRESAADEKWTSVDEGLRYFAKLFRWVKQSAFLTGKSPASPGRQVFTVDLEWLFNAANWLKVIEGKYHTED